MTSPSALPSGAPRAWRLGGGSQGARIVTRDYAGQVTRIVDSYGGSTWSDVSYSYDLDGDVLTETDNSPSHTWLRSIPAAPQSRTYGYDSARHKDVLKSWVDNGSDEAVVYDDAGRRSSETDGASSFTYAYDPSFQERMLSKTNDAITSREEVLLRHDEAGRVTALDWFADGGGAWDVTYGYGGLGNVETTSTSSGTTTDSYDFEMRLVRIKDPTGNLRRMRYAWGRSPLEETYTTTAGTWHYQNIYLAGEPIAQIAESPTATAALRFLHTDRMGLPRKIATTNGTRLQRIIFDAWGASSSIRNDTVTDNVVEPMPSWPWRYPGQRSTGSNGWRQYIAKVGQYASPEPLQMQAASTFSGPQAYAYAAARPLSGIDPDALSPTELSSCETTGPLTVCMPTNGMSVGLVAPVGAAGAASAARTAGAALGRTGAAGAGASSGTGIGAWLGGLLGAVTSALVPSPGGGGLLPPPPPSSPSSPGDPCRKSCGEELAGSVAGCAQASPWRSGNHWEWCISDAFEKYMFCKANQEGADIDPNDWINLP